MIPITSKTRAAGFMTRAGTIFLPMPLGILRRCCRHCNSTIKVTDQKITQYSATVGLETCGSVTIEKKGALVVQKRVVAANLMLKGSTPDVEFGCFAFASMLVTMPVIAITQLATQVLLPIMSASVRGAPGSADRLHS